MLEVLLEMNDDRGREMSERPDEGGQGEDVGDRGTWTKLEAEGLSLVCF